MNEVTAQQLDKMFGVEIAHDGPRFACVVPTWRARPDQSVSDYVPDFESNWHLAAGAFGCRPSQDGTRYVRNFKLLRALVNEGREHPINKDGTWASWFTPEETIYYAHLDLSTTHDATGMAVASWHNFTPDEYAVWSKGQIARHGSSRTEALDSLKFKDIPDDAGYVKVDLMLSTEVPRGDEIRLWHARAKILEMDRMGFAFGKVTADQFQSKETMQRLNDAGIPSEHFSVERTNVAYDRFMELVAGQQVDMYNYPKFLQEMEELLLVDGKVDHPSGGSNDVAEAVVAAVYWAYEMGRAPPAVR